MHTKHYSFRHMRSTICAILLFGTMFSLYLYDIVNWQKPHELVLNVEMITPQYGAAGFAPWIDGNFTVTGAGPDSLINLTLILDGIVLISVAGNRLSFFLNTRIYSQGISNITLYGRDAHAQILQKTRFFIFTPNLIVYSMIILIGSFGFVAIDALIIYFKEKLTKDKEMNDTPTIEIEPI